MIASAAIMRPLSQRMRNGRVFEVEPDDIFAFDARADMLGLRLHLLHQPRALDRLGEAGIVLDVGGDHELAARLEARQQQRLQHRAGGVDRGRVAGRPGPDDDDALVRDMGRSQDEPLFGEYGAGADRARSPLVSKPYMGGAVALQRRRPRRPRFAAAPWPSVWRRSCLSFAPPPRRHSSAKCGSSPRCWVSRSGSRFRPPTPTIRRTSLRRQNPLGKIPALILENGETIFDSAVIVDYLDWLAGGGKIIPSEPQARFRSLTQQALADGIAEAAVLIRYEILWREPPQRSEKWIAYQNEKIARALRAFEARPPEELIDAGTIALACALGYLDLRFEGAWRADHPRLVAWLEVFSEATPSFEATRFRG